MVFRDYVESDVERLLGELCIRLGLCLSPDDARRLEESPPGDVDSFTVAVLDAGDTGDRLAADVRQRVREVVEWHMSRWNRDAAESGEGWWSPQ